MRQRGKSFLQEAEIQWDRWRFAVAGDGISGRGDSERGWRALIFVADFDFWKGGMTEGRCPIRQSWRIHNRGQRQKGNKQY